MPCRFLGGGDSLILTGFNPSFLIDALGTLTGQNVIVEARQSTPSASSRSRYSPTDSAEEAFLFNSRSLMTFRKVRKSNSDGDGVGDACDECPGTPPGAPVDERGCMTVARADFDFDGDVDMDDFGVLQACVRGTGMPIAPGCEFADLNGDGSVDQGDVFLFMGCFSGANVEADIMCAN